MNPKPAPGEVVRIVVVVLSVAVGLTLADIVHVWGNRGQPIAWGREVMGSLAGGLVIAGVVGDGGEGQ